MDNSLTMKIKENETSYNLKFALESNSLVINVSEDESVPAINYTSNFQLSDLVKQSRYFKLFESLEELMPEINKLCLDNKIKIKRSKNAVILLFSLPIGIVKEASLTISQAKVDTEQVIADLCSTVNNLKKEIKLLKSNIITEEQLEKNLKSKDILLDEKEKQMVNNWILKIMKSEGKKIQMTLLYKMANFSGSFYASQFHNNCNNRGYTLTLVRSTKGYRCGGFTTQNWSSSSTSYNYNKNDSNAFLFSLEYKEMYPSYDGTNAIQDYYGYGPCFGSTNDLYITDNCHQNFSQCDFPSYYYGNKVRSLTGGCRYFKVNELEVYKIEII